MPTVTPPRAWARPEGALYTHHIFGFSVPALRIDGFTSIRLYGKLVCMKKLTVQVEEDLLRRFRIAAMKEGKSVSEVIRGFVAAYVERKGAGE